MDTPNTDCLKLKELEAFALRKTGRGARSRMMSHLMDCPICSERFTRIRKPGRLNLQSDISNRSGRVFLRIAVVLFVMVMLAIRYLPSSPTKKPVAHQPPRRNAFVPLKKYHTEEHLSAVTTDSVNYGNYCNAVASRYTSAFPNRAVDALLAGTALVDLEICTKAENAVKTEGLKETLQRFSYDLTGNGRVKLDDSQQRLALINLIGHRGYYEMMNLGIWLEENRFAVARGQGPIEHRVPLEQALLSVHFKQLPSSLTQNLYTLHSLIKSETGTAEELRSQLTNTIDPLKLRTVVVY